MKATFEFDMMEERTEMEDAINGWRYSLALSNIKNHVRSMWKHGNYSEEQFKVIDEIYEYICNEVVESRMEE